METFYTFQGEGLYTGTPAFFIRLAGCDVGCVWCDVKESWDAAKHPLVAVSDLVRAAKESGAPIVVITGGEPAMYPLGELTDGIRANGQRTHIETSGAHPLSGTWDWITLSPKKFKSARSEVFAQADELKVIVFHKSDLEWAEVQSKKMTENACLFLQAEWDKRDEISPLVVAYITQHPQWRLSVQIHKYLGVS